MKYSSSCRKPYRPLTASSTATNTAAITHARTGTRSEGETGPCAAGESTTAAASGVGTAEPLGWSMAKPPAACPAGKSPAGKCMPDDRHPSLVLPQRRLGAACRTRRTFSAIQSLLVSLTGRVRPPGTTWRTVCPECEEIVTWARNSRVEPVPTTILPGRSARGLPTGFQFIPFPGRTLYLGPSPRRSTSLASPVVTSGLGMVIVDITAPFSIRDQDLLSDCWSVPWRPRP